MQGILVIKTLPENHSDYTTAARTPTTLPPTPFRSSETRETLALVDSPGSTTSTTTSVRSVSAEASGLDTAGWVAMTTCW